VRVSLCLSGRLKPFPATHTERNKPFPFQELMVSTLAMTDTVVKLLIQKGVFTEEFKTQLGAERVNHLAVLKRLH
jgi:hypothetical protein